jgi:hypothetical protein
VTSQPPGPCFDRDIKPLFLPFDRDQMRFAFDLWNYAEVKDNAAVILQRLALGDMPCDQPWPEDRIALFRAWLAAGCPP